MIEKINIGDIFTYHDLKNIYMVTNLDLIGKTIQALYMGQSDSGKYTLRSIPYVMSPVVSMIFLKEGEIDLAISQAGRETTVYESPHILDKRYPKIVFNKHNGDAFLMVKNVHTGSRMYNMISFGLKGNNFILPESRIYDYELAPCNTTIKLKR